MTTVVVAGSGALAAAVARRVAEQAALVAVVAAEGPAGPLAAVGDAFGIPVLDGRRAPAALVAAPPDLLLTVDHPVSLLAASRAALGAGTTVVNLHPGFLPTFRGPDALARAIAAGELRLGVVAHLVDHDVWTGDLLEVRGFSLDELEDRGDAEARATSVALALAEDVVRRVARGPLLGRPQPAPDLWFPDRPLGRRGRIDWCRPAHQVHDLVRAMTRPGPGAHTELHGVRVPVWRTVVADEPWADGVPGEVVEVSDDHAVVATGDGLVALLDVDRPEVVDLRVGDVLGRR